MWSLHFLSGPRHRERSPRSSLHRGPCVHFIVRSLQALHLQISIFSLFRHATCTSPRPKIHRDASARSLSIFRPIEDFYEFLQNLYHRWMYNRSSVSRCSCFSETKPFHRVILHKRSQDHPMSLKLCCKSLWSHDVRIEGELCIICNDNVYIPFRNKPQWYWYKRHVTYRQSERAMIHQNRIAQFQCRLVNKMMSEMKCEY